MNRPPGGWRLKRDSAYKLVVWFADGNRRTFYSLDWKNERSATFDAPLGLARLKKLAIKHGPSTRSAVIYDNQHGTPLFKLANGAMQNIS